MDALTPWTHPPAVHVFGPGVAKWGIDYSFKHVVLDALQDIDEEEDEFNRQYANKMRALREHGERMVREKTASLGDFVTMTYDSCRNASLVGFVVGENGLIVDTRTFVQIRSESLAPRMMLPAQLVPADANPVRLFMPLFHYSYYIATAAVCLPNDSALLRMLGVAPVRDHEVVMMAVDHDWFSCWDDVRYAGHPITRLIQWAQRTGMPMSRGLCLSMVPTTTVRTSFYDHFDSLMNRAPLFASNDGLRWIDGDGAVRYVVYLNNDPRDPPTRPRSA